MRMFSAGPKHKHIGLHSGQRVQDFQNWLLVENYQRKLTDVQLLAIITPNSRTPMGPCLPEPCRRDSNRWTASVLTSIAMGTTESRPASGAFLHLSHLGDSDPHSPGSTVPVLS